VAFWYNSGVLSSKLRTKDFLHHRNIGFIFIPNAGLPYLQTSTSSRLQSEYLKHQNLTCLLAALHQCPQYRYTRCCTERNGCLAAHRENHCILWQLLLITQQFTICQNSFQEYEFLVFIYVCVCMHHMMISAIQDLCFIILWNDSINVNLIVRSQFGIFTECNVIQGDSGGICTTLGNDSMSDSKQKSSYEHGSDLERLRSYGHF